MPDALYRTSDIWFAAFLKVAQVPFLGVEGDRKKTVFLFEDQGPAIMRDLKNGYFMDTTKVAALSYSQAIRALKAMVIR